MFDTILNIFFYFFVFLLVGVMILSGIDKLKQRFLNKGNGPKTPSTTIKTKKDRPNLRVIENENPPDPFSGVSPQMAATAMMIAIAKQSRAMSERDMNDILGFMKNVLQIPQSQTKKYVTEAENLCNKADDTLHLFNCLAGSINDSCTIEEKEELYEMLCSLAVSETSEPNKEQIEALKTLTEYLEIRIQ